MVKCEASVVTESALYVVTSGLAITSKRKIDFS